MERLTDKGILLVFSLFLLPHIPVSAHFIAGFLFLIAAGSLEDILPENFASVLCLALSLLFCLDSLWLYFLPVIIYCCLGRRLVLFRFLWVLPFCYALLTGISFSTVFLILLSLFAILLDHRTKKSEELRIHFHQIQDLTKENELQLEKKNRELLEKQDYEVRLATLSERNRIAREIHDNVGHLLTRALLQVGALEVVYKKEPELTGQLSAVKATLSDAMDNIRQSVHGLHEESFDLKTQIETLIREFPFCPVTLEYSAGQIPKEIQYCLTAIIKEALSNTARHSKATAASIRLMEHPGFYQLIIQDNGSGSTSTGTQGIGLTNMKERVELLHGVFRMEVQHGFRLFISIPKNRRDYENNHH